MIVKTRIFELNNNGYKNLSELAKSMGISVSQIYRVREGRRQINQKFIVGAIKAFPNYKLDDLFYLVLEPPTVNKEHQQPSAMPCTDEPAAEEKPRIESIRRLPVETTTGVVGDKIGQKTPKDPFSEGSP